MNHNLSKLLVASLVLGASWMLPAPNAQAESFPYRFCTQSIDTPDQELTNAIAKFLDHNYEDEVKLVYPVCYGRNPLMNNRETWVYQAEFKKGGAVDVSVIESTDGRRISVKDSQFRTDENGWTKWNPLDR